MTLLALPKIAHPDFAIPGKKPVGLVEVDWSNPLSSGLVYSWDFINNGLLDSVRNEKIDSTANRVGNDLGFIGTTATVADTASAIDLSYTKTFSILIDFVWDSFANNDDLLLESSTNSNSGGNPHSLIINPNDSVTNGGDGFGVFVKAAGGGSFNGGSFARPSSNGRHTLCMTVDKNLGTALCIRAYLDGIEQSITQSLSSDQSSSHGGNHKWYLFSRASSSLLASGRLKCLRVWDRTLTSPEAALLSGNPYQVLKPATPLFFFAPAAGGATVAKPMGHHLTDRQHAAIAAHRLGGLLQ